MKTTEPLPIEIAVAIAGGQTALASALAHRFPKVSQAHVWNWIERQKEDGKPHVPAEYCPSIERLTSGQVTCEMLQPKVDWAYLREHVAEE